MRLAPTVLLLLLATSVAAQTPLTVGQSVEGTLATGDADAYTLALSADQFVFGAADQQTVDVVVTVTGPDGAEVLEVDGPARGPEVFQFEAEAAGDYTITITPFEDGEGAYALRIDRAEPVATTPAGTARQLMAAFDRPDAPGGIVVVVEDGAVVFEEAFGLADLTTMRPYTLDTPTNIGSTSKQFTAFALVTLAEQGLLDLDDDVRDYIPELPDFGETVTLRNLLTHTSGYREFLNTLVVAGRRLGEGDAIHRDEIIRMIQRQPDLQNAPGAEWNYNNSGFALATLVVERVADQPFDEWVAENVFAPAGMADTRFRTSPQAIVPNRAAGYARGENGAWADVPDLGGAMGAGGIYTTARDLARWMATVHLGDAFPARYAQMTERAVLTTGDTTSYGLGLFLSEFEGVPTVHHGGADNAHRSAFVVFPTLDAGVLVLTNSATNTDAIAYRTAQAFFPEAFSDDADSDEPVAEAADFDPADFDDALFDGYAGRYSLDEAPAFVLEFRRDGDGGYETQATGQAALEIVPRSDSSFVLTAVEAAVTFHRGPDGRVRSATLHQNGDHPATRIEEPTEALDLAAYEGRYFSDELETFYTVVVEDGDLVSRHLRTGDVTLSHVSGDTFTGSGPTLEFERDADGEVTAFVVDFGRTRGIRFERFE